YPEIATQIKPHLSQLVPYMVAHEYPIMQALGQGYILTSMIWGAAVAFLIDKQVFKASIALLTGGVFTYFGITHSVLSNGAMYFPWELKDVQMQTIVYSLATSYIVLAFV